MAWYNQRTDFQIQEFYRRLEQMGYAMYWEKSALCSCIPKDRDGQPDFNCPQCKGKGRYWYDNQVIKGVMTSLTGKEVWNQSGEILQGTSWFTSHGWNRVGYWDRLTNAHSKMRWSEILTRGTYGTIDRLRFEPVNILDLRTVTQKYKNGIDFTFEGGGIKWISGEIAPPVGEQYTVDYYTHPRWIVIDVPNIVRDTFVKSKLPGITFLQLPVRAMVRLEFYVTSFFNTTSE